MVNATHAEAVAALKSVTTSCHLVISREVVVVLPTSIMEVDEDQEEEQLAPVLDGAEPAIEAEPPVEVKDKEMMKTEEPFGCVYIVVFEQ